MSKFKPKSIYTSVTVKTGKMTKLLDKEITRENKKMIEGLKKVYFKKKKKVIFVFGSNLAGRHGKGAALTARNKYGAEYGRGKGRTGNAYAIPTKSRTLKTLPLRRIRYYVSQFIFYAKRHPDLVFKVTKIGCGLAGYYEFQIAPMFNFAPENCNLPEGWDDIIMGDKDE